jgi:hypothetical protein
MGDLLVRNPAAINMRPRIQTTRESPFASGDDS